MASQWRPGQAVTDSVKLSDIACALSFGQGDDMFAKIELQLRKRGCATVGDWRDWTKGEFFTLMKSSCILLRKSRQAYLKGFESATGVTLRTGIEVAEGNGLMKQEKKSSGGDMMAQSRKGTLRHLQRDEVVARPARV